MFKIQTFVFNPFAENTYIVWDEKSLEAMVVDPGCYHPDEESEIAEFIKKNNLAVKFVVATHCHIDHILGIRFIKDKYNPEFYASEKDLPLLEYSEKQAEVFGLNIKKPPKPDIFITEDTVLKLGSKPAKFIFTPGHTPGEYCIYIEEDKFCLTGDVLFLRGIGRTDLWGGDYNLIINSIRSKLFTLPDDVSIYPGHGEPTKIGDEKAENPYLLNPDDE